MPAKFNLYSELGVVGVQEYAGKLSDRYSSVLRGSDGIIKMARVLRREPSAFTAWSMITLSAQGVRWYVPPASSAKADQDCASFIESNLSDMSHSMQYAVKFAMSAWPFGFADEEIVWKKRLGQNPGRDLSPSKWDDGLVGIRKLAPRRQETIYQWTLDENGGKKGLVQQDPATGKMMPEIPIEKLLHFIGGDDRGSWEGLGWLEPAYWIAYLIEQLEQIGGATSQRGGTGLPVFTFLAPPDDKTLSAVEDIGEGLTAGELQYIKLPGPLVGFDLKTVSLSNLGDIRGWIDQLRWEISALVAATFVRLGSTERGTQSLGGTMHDAFTEGVDGCLDGVTDVLNRHLVPRLLANNPGKFSGISDHPQIAHSPVTMLPPATAQWLDKVQTWLDSADSADVEWLRSIFGMPYRSAQDIQAQRDEKRKEEEKAAEAAKKEADKKAKEQAKAGVPPTPEGISPAQPAAPGTPVEAPQKQEQPGPKAEAGAEQPKGQAEAGESDLWNPNHEPAGSAKGGQFAKGSGGGAPTAGKGESHGASTSVPTHEASPVYEAFGKHVFVDEAGEKHKFEYKADAEYARSDYLAGVPELAAELQKTHDVWKRGLEPGEKKAVVKYTTSDYKEINNSLRHGTANSSAESAVPLIEKAINQTRLPRDLVLYRGVSNAVAKQFSPGAIVKDKGFVSTTISESLSRGFINSETVLRIHAPKGSHAAFLDATSKYSEELEVLLQHGSQFRVTGRTDNFIDMELVG